MSETGVATVRDPGTRPRVGVSSCLLGEPVRFNGGHSRCRFLTDELGPYVDWVPYCPEMEIGLGSPRETLRLTADGHLVSRSGRDDHTTAMAALPLPGGIDGYVFKAKSPSCGIHGVPSLRPERPAVRSPRARRVAERVMARFPLLPAEDEGQLNDAVLREEFTERVFAFARLRELLSGPWEPSNLVSFPRPAQASAARPRSGALPGRWPDCRRGREHREGGYRARVPGRVPGGDDHQGQPGP